MQIFCGNTANGTVHGTVEQAVPETNRDGPACGCGPFAERPADCMCQDRFTVVLEDMDGEEDCCTAHVRGKGAAAWAKAAQTIDGSSWEADGPDFAYTILTNYKGLVHNLENEGYVVDQTAFTPVD